MGYRIHKWIRVIASGFVWAATAGATSVPTLSFEQMTDQSEMIVSGQIDRSWADWDSEHKYIWTHYALSVSSAIKGNAGSMVTFSEPGGVVGAQGMAVAGTPVYKSGDQVLLFLERMPNGYLRTTGWGQGKFMVDASGRVRNGAIIGGPELVDAKGRPAASRIKSLDGMSVDQVRSLVTAHMKAQSQGRTH